MIPWIVASSGMSSSAVDSQRYGLIGWSNVYVPRHSQCWSMAGPKKGGFTNNGAFGKGARSRPSYSSWRLIHWLSARNDYVSVVISRDSRPWADRGGIPLLQYADDTTFFIRGSTVTAHHVSTMLDIFSDFSGQQLNRNNSSVVNIGLASKELALVSAMLATPVASFPIRYLGLPLAEGRLRALDYQSVMAKIEARLGGWQARLLSRGGRLVLLQSVLAAIPIYFMAIFRIPEGMRRQIESIMRRFFWQGTWPSETRGEAIVAWRIVCRPKSLNTLGIRHLRRTNTALLAKWVNCIMQQSEDLAMVV